MSCAANSGVASDPLAVWYLEAEPVFYALSDCCDIVRDIRSGALDFPLKHLHDLSAMTQDSELWLLTNPSPGPRHGEYLDSILQIFVALGELFEGFVHELAQADDGTLDAKIAQAVGQVEELARIRDERIMRAMRRP